MDLLGLLLVMLLVMATGTDSLIMGETSNKTAPGCVCPLTPPSVTCPSTHTALILQAHYGFKFLSTCPSSICSPDCCETASDDCLLPYSGTEISDLQDSCVGKHNCGVIPTKETRLCNDRENYSYSRVDYVCVNATMGVISREQSVLGDIVYVKLAGTDAVEDQKQYEKAVCVAESQSGEAMVEITFLLPNFSPGASADVKVGETTHHLTTRNTTGRVASPARITFVQGDAKLTVWALLQSNNTKVNVTCTSQTGPVPEAESHMIGAIVGGVAAGLVLVAVVVILVFYFKKTRFRTSRQDRRGMRGTTGNLSDDTTRGNEYAVVELQDIKDMDMDAYLQRGQPISADRTVGEEDYDRLGQPRPRNNNDGELNTYGHIRNSTSANGDNDYDHVVRGPKPGSITEYYA